MRKTFITICLLACMAFCMRAQVSFSGNSRDFFVETPAKNTGLDKIYVLYSTQGVSMSYTASSASADVKWYSYGEQGGAYAEEITGVTKQGAVTTLANVVPEQGYIIEEGTDRTYIWVVDYSRHRLNLTALTTEDASDCGTATLNVAGSGPDLAYFTITGVRRVLNREMTLDYRTLRWSDEQTQWNQVDTTAVEESFKSTIVVPAPLCNTTFTLTGDRFLAFWGEQKSVESDTYVTNSVDVRATAEQETRENDNEKTDPNLATLGGSAPVHIVFTAYPTDAVVHNEWQMAADPEFNEVMLRLNQLEVDEIFEEAGTTYWRFIGSNADGTCEATSETFTVDIGTSELLCPNVFTPGTSEGTNDEWKVSYKSIVDFHCWIFNRWGNLIIEFRDPSQGWDGTYKGKLVKSGVYYYVIEARGSDGHKYKLSGDINIIRSKKEFMGGGSGGDDEPDDPDVPEE